MYKFLLAGYPRPILLNLFAIVGLLAEGWTQNQASEKARWQGLIPIITDVLIKEGTTCPGNRMRVGIKDAADLGGHSLALVGFCPGGAYTDWIVAMELKDGRPVSARFRNSRGEIRDLGLAEGASVMHGKDAKLVAERQAIYDISWDNDGLDKSGVIRLQKCLVEAYVLNTQAGTFDYNEKLTKEATKSYCQELKHQTH